MVKRIENEIRRGNQDEDATSAFINIHELVELGNIPSFPLHPTSINANASFNASCHASSSPSSKKHLRGAAVP
jgi:hypothetical protein